MGKRGFDWVEGVAPYSLRRLIYHPDYRRLLAMLHMLSSLNLAVVLLY